MLCLFSIRIFSEKLSKKKRSEYVYRVIFMVFYLVLFEKAYGYDSIGQNVTLYDSNK